MPDIPRQQLQYIITQFGRSVCDEPKRCEALLKDLCPNHKREVRLLVVALREGVVKTLTYPPSFLTIENVIMQLVQRLYDEWGIAVELGQWAVESWAMVLGVKFSPNFDNHNLSSHNTKLLQLKQQALIEPSDILLAQFNQSFQIVNDDSRRWQKIGTNGETLPIDAPQWAAVIDPKTKLMWAVNLNKTDDFPNPLQAMPLENAKIWIKLMNQKMWCGYHDWRLPNIDELQTLLLPYKIDGLLINTQIFTDIHHIIYYVWSSSTVNKKVKNNRIVIFHDDDKTDNATMFKDEYCYLRLVRSC